MINAQNVVKWFGPTLAVDDVSFEVKRGEVLGFLGPNGAGKSTTMRIITGFIPASSGSVSIDGHNVEDDGIAAKKLIGYLPENAPAYPEMSVEGFLKFVADVRGLTGTARKDAIERVIATCQLSRVVRKSIETLSKGYRHRTCFAQSLLHDPPVLVLDEPTDGLDPNQKHEVRQLIKSMGESKAIIVSTHILEEVDAMCNRAIIIDRGKMVFNGSPSELRAKSEFAGAVTVRVPDQKAGDVQSCLSPLPAVGKVKVLDDTGSAVRVRVFPKDAVGAETPLASAVASALLAKQWVFDELHTEQGRLDDVFRAITLSDTVETGAKAPAGSKTSSEEAA